MKRSISQKEIEKRENENEEEIRISRREKKRQQFNKKNDPYQEDENYQWENEK